MLSQLNKIATDYGGLLGILGTVLGLIGLGYGFYARNNPAPSKHKLLFKTFAPGRFSDGFISALRKRKTPRTFVSFVDVWNCGTEPVSGGVIREPLSVGVQESEGQKLISASVVKESHPGVSQMKAVLDGATARLEWAFWDPGMSARLELVTMLPASGDEITIFGSGLRLQIVRARAFDDPTTPFGLSARIAIWSLGLGVFAVLFGLSLGWLSSRELSTLVLVAISLPVAFAVLLLISVATGVAFGVRTLLGWVLNARSPVEAALGGPELDSEVRKMLRAQMLSDKIRLEHLEQDLQLQDLLSPLKPGAKVEKLKQKP